MISVSWELTDTFCGQANYAWVRRGITQLKNNASKLAVMRAVKRDLGLSGVRCRVADYGDIIELKPYGACIVASFRFI
jgi:hypothetical protein